MGLTTAGGGRLGRPGVTQGLIGGCQQFINGDMRLFIKEGIMPLVGVAPPDVGGGSGDCVTSCGIGPTQNDGGGLVLAATILLLSPLGERFFQDCCSQRFFFFFPLALSLSLSLSLFQAFLVTGLSLGLVSLINEHRPSFFVPNPFVGMIPKKRGKRCSNKQDVVGGRGRYRFFSLSTKEHVFRPVVGCGRACRSNIQVNNHEEIQKSNSGLKRNFAYHISCALWPFWKAICIASVE